jgi:hypothetical protein
MEIFVDFRKERRIKAEKLFPSCGPNYDGKRDTQQIFLRRGKGKDKDVSLNLNCCFSRNIYNSEYI